MERILHWEKSRVLRGHYTEGADGALFVCPEAGLDYLLYDRERDPEIRLTEFACLLVTPKVLEDHSVCFQLAFHEKDGEEPTMRVIFGLIPGAEVPVPFDFRWLDSQTLFPERSLGRQKMTVFGKAVRLADVERIRLQTSPGFEPFRVSFRECRLLGRVPEISLPREQRIDDLGQWMPKSWKGKVQDRASCNRILRSLDERARRVGDAFAVPGWDRFGGYSGKRFAKTGWFHAEKDGRRFWLADPDGNAFLSTGVDCITPGVETRIGPAAPWVGEKQRGARSCNYGIANLTEAFGPDNWRSAWERIVKGCLKSWGVNTIGNWSDPELIRSADMPYVLSADAVSESGFPQTERRLFRDFPDVFSEDYRKASERYAAGLAPYRDDPNLIGYFMRNEPQWAFVYGLDLAEETLANPAPLASRDWLIARLKEQYGEIASLNAAWDTRFAGFDDLRKPLHQAASLSAAAAADLRNYSGILIARYVEIPAAALRRADPHHLNLGMRYAYITDPGLLSGAACFDVFSINSYQRTPYDQVEQVGKLLDKPVMVGEFHHGALDRGLTAHGIRGVTTQEERGAAYRYYMEQAAKSRYFVGAHYFQFNDQSCLGRFDGENYQIGLVDVCMQEYAEMTAGMKACHTVLYQVALGEREAFSRIPEEVAPIHY